MSPRQMGHWESAAASAGPAWGGWLMPPSLAAEPLSPMASSPPDAMSCQKRRAKCWSLSGGGALRLALSPPQGARVAEPVEAWHDKAGLLPAAQEDGTAVV